MEAMGALSEGAWNSFSGMLLPTGEADFMAHLLANYSFPSEQDWASSMGIQTTTSPCLDANLDMTGSGGGLYSSSDTFNFYSFPGGSSYNSDSGTFFFPDLIHEKYHITDSNQMMMESNGSVSTDFCMVDQTNAYSSFQVFTDDNIMEEPVCFNDEVSSENMGGCGGNPAEDVAHPDKKLQHKRKYDMPTLNLGMEVENSAKPSENPQKKKTTHVSEVQRNKKIVKSKKNQKLIPTTDIEGEANAGMNRQSSGSYCSEDDSDASQELKGGVTSSPKGSTALNLNGKTRASRGSATDPQSLYARKRRERINERLRILQNLVPNGTKVDISTMLEEAVQYVKFLQLQIKLLSSDDLWMYAPIAYNGVDIGLDLKISAPR